MADFATVQDVADRWRPLTSTEITLAGFLITDASDMVRVRWPDIDSRVSSGAIAESTLVRVVSGMVRRAMLNRDREGVVQMQETTGPFSEGATFANPTNNLYFSNDDILALQPTGFARRSRMGWLA